MRLATTDFETTYQLRVDASTKRDAFAVFRDLGISPAQGMRKFLTLVASTKSVPFEVDVPNAATRKVLDEIDAGIGLRKAKDANDLFRQLGI
jgi:DNA-damage-inducible protein J